MKKNGESSERSSRFKMFRQSKVFIELIKKVIKNINRVRLL